MGLLSKIFNTDKLAYILREEEEFSVTAPKQWNVETLTVGDTITPDMFKNQHRYYNFDLYIKEIGYDDDYLDDPESAGYYVTTEFGDSVEGNLKYLDNQLTWGLGEINKYLKPKYKVVTTDLSESEDEFNVNAPQNWNIEYLSIGDQITPDMWNQESKLIWDLLDTDINKTYKIQSIEAEWDDYISFVELEDETGHIISEPLNILQSALKPEFKITQNKNLTEVEDEFNVAAPPEWNEIELGVGDLITPENSTTGNYYLIKSIGGNHVWVRKGTLDYNGEFKPQHSVDFHTHLNILQSRMKPGFTITQNKNLNEVEDEFNVDAPEDWNITELKIGDIITPDMWQDVKYTNSFRLSPWFIKKIENHGENGKLVHVKNDLDSSYWIEISSFNKDYLKPQYQVTDSLSESDDEDFNVNAPEDWNVTELGVGDIVTSNMFKTKEDIKFWMNYTDKLQILTIFKEYDEWIVVLGLPNTNERYVSWVIRNANKDLKPQYKIEQNLTESEEDFNVEAPTEWDITELGKGDIITPDMFKDNYRFYDFDLYIKEIGYDDEYEYDDDMGNDMEGDFYVTTEFDNSAKKYLHNQHTWWFHEINKYLKPQYQVVPPLFESEEDEFNVNAPVEWDVTELEKGDYIMPDMWVKDIDDFFTGQSESKYLFKQLTSKPIKITGVMRGDELYFEVAGLYFILTNDFLLPQYKVVGDFGMYESNEDEFTVDAPSEWDVTELSKGDIITPDMWKDDLINWNHDVKIDGFKPYNNEVGYMVYIKHLDSNRTPSQVFDLGEINDWLKNTYRVEVNGLMESDEDDFSVDAPTKWNVTDLEIGDYIYPDMINVPRDKRKWEYYHNMLADPKRTDGWQITGFKKHGVRDLVKLEYNGVGNFFDVDLINNTLKQYRIFPPTNETKLSSLLEIDDEEDFSVDAPENWNVTELGIGSILDSSNLKMQDPMKKFEIVDFKVSLFPWGHNEAVLKVFQLKDEPIPGTNRTTRQWKYIRNIFVDIETLNDRLKDNYKITPSLRESEDDFSVDAPQEWNVKFLTTGDTITPDMWDLNNSNLDNYVDNPNEDWIIDEVDGEDIEISTKVWGGEFWGRLKDINSVLKPGYRIVQNKDLFEGEEDFSVDAPQEWNVEYLTTGDTITPDMWDQSKIGRRKDFFSKPIKIDSIGYNEFDNEEEEPLVGLDLGDTTTEYDIDFVNYLLKPEFKVVQNKNLTEEEDFNVDAPAEWNRHELKVGDYFDDYIGEVYTREEDIPKDSRGFMYEIIYIGPNEGEYHKSAYYNHNIIVFRRVSNKNQTYSFTVEHFNETRGPKLNAYINLPNRFNLNEDEEDFNVDALPEWDVIELKVGDYINSNMLNPKGNDYTWFSRRKLFIEDIYFDECWTVNLLHVESGYHTPFCIDYINEDVLNDKYKIMTSLNELLEIDDEFDVEAPQKWDVIELGVGDKITRDMIKNPIFLDQMDEDFRMDFPGVITKIYLAGPLDDQWWGVRIKFQDVGWRKYLPQSKDIKLGLGFSLDGFNENTLKPQYQIQKPVFELSTLLENEEDFNVNAPDEWNVELLTVGDTVTPEMWGYEQINSWFDISKPLNIEDIGEDDGGWWVQLGRNEAPFDLDEVNEFLKPQYKIVPYNLEESDDEFNIDAPEEWNYDYWEPTEGISEDEYYKSFDEFVTRILRKYGVEDEFIEVYLDEVFNFGDFTSYEGISSGDLYKDFQQWIKAQDETSEWYDDMNEEEDFNVDAPEEWWEYDGNIEITFQDTYWYEDENGKEAIIERDGGGIININDLEQYSYSGWKPFTGNPTNENLTKWYSSIDWDTDLIEMFDFDDSLFEVEEDFDWSTAENVDMERTGFRIRAVSTLKEVDDEFTVKAPKKWDIVYLNKGDFLDNTNSTFNDPNVKYEIGNITSDGEIEVKKYINRGNGFEPQFDRFMKTRKGIVKAKLKPGFDIEAFSK